MDIVISSSDLITYGIIPLMIFCARICDVSIGTVRYLLISRGFKNYAPVFGFFEVIIWLIAMGQVMKNITNPLCYIAYGGGFAAGTYIGMEIEERMKLGYSIIRLITAKPAEDFIARLRKDNFRVTNFEAQGAFGKVTIIFMVVKRVNIQQLITLIRDFNPKAFFTIEDIRSSEGIVPAETSFSELLHFKRWLSFFAKRK